MIAHTLGSIAESDPRCARIRGGPRRCGIAQLAHQGPAAIQARPAAHQPTRRLAAQLPHLLHPAAHRSQGRLRRAHRSRQQPAAHTATATCRAPQSPAATRRRRACPPSRIARSTKRPPPTGRAPTRVKRRQTRSSGVDQASTAASTTLNSPNAVQRPIPHTIPHKPRPRGVGA